MAAPTVRGSFAANAAAASTTAVAVTLPAGIETGDEGFLVIGVNSGTTTITTEPSGWTLVEGPVTNAGTNVRSWLYARTMASSDSSASVTATLSATGRWTIGGVITAGAATPAEQAISWIENADDAALSIPAITPTNDDDLLVTLASIRWATTTKGVTATNGWTEEQESNTTNGTAPCFGVWAGTRALSGQNGIAQGTVDMTYAANARNNGWIISLAPVPSVIPPRPQVHPSAAVIRASTR